MPVCCVDMDSHRRQSAPAIGTLTLAEIGDRNPSRLLQKLNRGLFAKVQTECQVPLGNSMVSGECVLGIMGTAVYQGGEWKEQLWEPRWIGWAFMAFRKSQDFPQEDFSGKDTNESQNTPQVNGRSRQAPRFSWDFMPSKTTQKHNSEVDTITISSLKCFSFLSSSCLYDWMFEQQGSFP